MKIVSVYKSGGDFDLRYVSAMAFALKRYISVPYEFIILTDKPNEVNQFGTSIELKYDLPKWWCKIELFDPDHFYNKELDIVVYFDLDVLILKNIQLLIDTGLNCTFPLMLRSSDPVGKEYNWPSSSIMSWKGNQMVGVYKKFFSLGADYVINKAKGNIARAGQRTDQGFIRTCFGTISKFQDYLPKNYVVFKSPHYMQNPDLFDTATILNWTGKPRFHNMGDDYWEIRSTWETRINILTNQEK